MLAEGRTVGFLQALMSQEAAKLMLGLPKGSLEEATLQLFARAGFPVAKSSRSYRPSFDDPALDGRFIRAQEVARYVEDGFFDCGLTGQDWVQENNADVVQVCELIYSRASAQKSRWVLCVPEASPVKTAKDLAGKRVGEPDETFALVERDRTAVVVLRVEQHHLRPRCPGRSSPSPHCHPHRSTPVRRSIAFRRCLQRQHVCRHPCIAKR